MGYNSMKKIRANAMLNDSGNGNGRQPSRVPLGTDFTPLLLRSEFATGQSRTQHLNPNGFMHGHQGFQTRQHETEFLGGGARGLSVLEPQQGNGPEQSPGLTKTSERLETAEGPSNFYFLGAQHLLMRGQQSGLPQPRPRHQSGFNDISTWQQQIMAKQLQELQRQQQLQQLDQARQQSGFNDISQWQQQLMIKQLQERQRQQQQLRQIDQARQQNSINQLTSIVKQTAGGQLPALVNGAPVHDASNFLWPNEHIGGDSKVVPSSSQMFMVGGMNWMQRNGSPSMQGFPNGGVTFSDEQGQALRSMGFVSQQLDQSLYGAPIASMRGNLNQYSNLQGFPHDSADMLAKTSDNQAEKPLIQSASLNNSFQGDQCAAFEDQVCMQDGALVSKQEFQGKSFFGHVPGQGLSGEVLSGNIQQLNSVPRNAHVQELPGRQERPGWSGNSQEKTMPQVGPSQGLVALDPAEERILFNSDDGIWDAPLGRGNNMGTGAYGNPLESQDYLSAFPSIQSGSWSALMQSAVAETSSSDTGLQEEWSGLSFQKTELSTGNQAATFNDSGRAQTSWVDSNLQTASFLTSRPFPLSDDANMSPSSHNDPGFQQSNVKSPYVQSAKVRPNFSHESFQRSPKESCYKGLDRCPQQKPHVDGSHQVQSPMHLDNAPDGAWDGRIYEQSETASHSMDMELNSQNMRGSWVPQQTISSYNLGSHPGNKPNGWNINEALSSSTDAELKACENENIVQNSQSIDDKRTMQADRNYNSVLWKADGSRVSMPFPNSGPGLEQIKCGTGSPQVHSEDSQMNNFTTLPDPSNTKSNIEINQIVQCHPFNYGKHAFDSSLKYKGNETGGSYQLQLSNVPQGFESSSNISERASGETYDKKPESSFQKEISSDSFHSSRPHHTVTGGVDNAWLNAHDSNSLAGANQKSLGQMVRKTPGPRKFQYHPMGSLGVNMEPADTMKHVTLSQALSPQVTQGLKGQEKGYSKFVGHLSKNSMDIDKGQVADFQGSMKRSEETPSRGVLPMSAPFDGSSGFYAPNRTAQPSHNMLELLHKVDQSREHAVKQFDPSDHNQSFEMPEAEASETFVAHLRRTQSSASQGFGLRLAPPSQRLPVSEAVNDLDSRHADPEVAEKGRAWLASTAPVQSLSHSHELSQRENWDDKTSISGRTGNQNSLSNMQGKSAAFTSPLPYPRNQLQSQGGPAPNDLSLNGPFDSLASRLTQTNNHYDRVASDHSAQASLPGSSSRVPPFNLGSPADTSQSISSNSSYLRVSGQQLPALEFVPVSQPLVTSGMSQQGAFSKMLHNVWNNVSRQCPSAGQPHKLPTSLFPSTNLSNNNRETTSQAQKPGDQDTKKGVNISSVFGACSINPQRFHHGEDQPRKESFWQQVPSEKSELAPQTAVASQGQESVAKQLLDGNSIASASLLAQRHQQEIHRGSNGKDPVVASQTEHPSIQNPPSSNRDIKVFGGSMTPSNVHQNHPLLQQMQAMKDVEINPSKRILRRLKGRDFGPDGQQAAAKAGQPLLYGYNAVAGDAVDNELKSASQRGSFSSGDAKMLSFTSDVRGDANANVVSQLIPSQDMVTFGQNDYQNQSSNMNIPPTRAEHSKISLQMAPSWFEQYGTFKNGQMLPMYDARRTAKTAEQQFFFGKPSESLPMHTQIDQVNAADASQVSSVWHGTTSTVVASERSSPPHSLPPDGTDQSLTVMRPKKRKSATLELLPWHNVVTQGSQRLHNISFAELDWAQATNRLIEKAEDEAEMIEDVQPLVRPRRRLTLTTQLMQQLFCPAPASIFSAEASSNYESIIYFVAKLALGDACSLISIPGSGSCVPPDNPNMTSENDKISKKTGGDQYFSKAVEDFIGRARDLENDLLRLDKRVSIVDLQVDCQDLESFSVINRFAKFHGRGHADGAEASSSSNAGATPQKIYPQRYVTALPLPRNLPDGVQCLSL